MTIIPISVRSFAKSFYITLQKYSYKLSRTISIHISSEIWYVVCHRSDYKLGIKIPERTSTEMDKIVKADGKKISVSGEQKTWTHIK